MIEFFVASCIVGCLASWIICFARKFEVRGGGSIVEWVQAHAPRLVGEMTRCDFCFSFSKNLYVSSKLSILWAYAYNSLL